MGFGGVGVVGGVEGGLEPELVCVGGVMLLMMLKQFAVAVAIVLVMMDPRGIPRQKGTKGAAYNWRLHFHSNPKRGMEKQSGT